MSENSDPLHAVLPVLAERERVATERVKAAELEMAAAAAELRDVQTARVTLERLAGVQTATVTFDETTETVQVDTIRLEGMAAVEQALRDSPIALTLPELTAAVAQLGWIPDTDQPERAVRASANRLRKRKPAEFDYAGKRFLYRPRHVIGRPGQAPFLKDEVDEES